MAISLAGVGRGHYTTAARVALELVQRYRKQPFIPPMLLNVNVPDLPYEELQGTAVTRLGKRHKAEPVMKSTNPRGETVYWVGAAGSAQDAGKGTDFHAVANQCVSVTPLQVDLTHFDQLENLQNWVQA